MIIVAYFAKSQYYDYDQPTKKIASAEGKAKYSKYLLEKQKKYNFQAIMQT